MDLWVGWVLVGALMVSALIGALALRRGPRSPLRWGPWVLALAGVVLLAVLTWADRTVSQGDLDEAAATVADRLDGATYVLPDQELRRQVGEALGRPVDLATTRDAEPDTAERQSTAYDVTLRGDDGGPTACLTVVVTGEAGEQQTSATAESGACS